MRVLTLTLLLLTVPLIGCIGQEESPEPLQEDTTTEPIRDVAAQAYRPGTAQEPASLVDDAASALPDGVDFPDGLSVLTGFTQFEPTIGVTSDGALFVSNLEGASLADPAERVTTYSSIVRSTDQGQTWEDITPTIGPVSSPPNSNDPYVYVDEATDRVYNLDMQGLACNYIQWSDDGGESWTSNPLGCGQPPLMDHPTIFAGAPRMAVTTLYENVVYLCVNRVADSACATSLDGGVTWAGWKTVFAGANEDGGFCGGLHAHGVTAPDGTAYLPKGQCGTPMVAISQDDGLTWETVAISEAVGIDGHEVAFDVDEAGNAYAFWMNDDQGYLAVSTDGGFTWNDAMRVTPPDVNIARFPTLAAGAEGRIAFAYTGTTTDKDQGDMEANDTWNAYITTATNATSEDLVLLTVTANDPADPIARGPCEGRCFGESGGALGDFIDIVIDDDGRPWAIFVDVCTEGCAEPGGTENDHGVGLVGTLRTGPSLKGELTSLPALGAPAPAPNATSQ